jgi:Zn-dependent protease
MGAATALGLLGSILFHEPAHSLVARRYGIRISGITLFIFGGVAEMETEPPSAQSELFMAIAGPAASMVLGSLLLVPLGMSSSLPAITMVLRYLGVINWTVAIFNLVPAFPLDGGRVLRAWLWWWGHDLLWATRIASAFGNVFGGLLILLGVLRVVTGDFIGGMWSFLMGVIGDSIPGIFRALQEGAITMQQGGGVAYDFSTLRPRGSRSRSAGTIASGPVAFMDVWDAMCGTIQTTGARRGAMMATLRCDHPDIEEFLDAKRKPGRLRRFNLSVQVTDAFTQAIAKDEP